MSYAEFQERYEQESDAEYRRYRAMPTRALVDAIRSGRFGEQYQLWRAVADTATLDEAGWALFAVIAGDAPYLDRYHAAGALLSLMRSERFVAADLSVASPRRQDCIAAVERDLRDRLGAPLGSGRPSP